MFHNRYLYTLPKLIRFLTYSSIKQKYQSYTNYKHEFFSDNSSVTFFNH